MNVNLNVPSIVFLLLIPFLVNSEPVHGSETSHQADGELDPEVVSTIISDYGIEDWIVLFIDVETTGLDPEYNEMIDVGIVVSNVKGTGQDTFFTRIMPNHPERTAPGARKVNGFSVRRWEKQGAVEPGKAVYLVETFIEEHTEGKRVLLSAYNASFDRGFLNQLFDRHGVKFEDFHDGVLDLPGLAAQLGFGYGSAGDLARKLRVADEPRHSTNQPWKHTGLTGAKLNHRLYSQLIKKDKYKGMSPEQIKKLQGELIEK